MHYEAEPLTQAQRLRIQAYKDQEEQEEWNRLRIQASQAADQEEQEDWNTMEEEEELLSGQEEQDQDGKASDDLWDVSPISGDSM